MTSFIESLKSLRIQTTNGMDTLQTSGQPLMDLFYKGGAMRGKDIIPMFSLAYNTDPELAMRIALWLRDARKGAGERELFRSIIRYLEVVRPPSAFDLLSRVPELGRWDDLLCVKTPGAKRFAFNMIADALQAKNGLCAKWMPRKGPVAKQLAIHLGLTPKNYRKLIVGLTQVVETQMCNKEWDEINFNHVPSLAHSRYRKAFARNSTKYAEYTNKLSTGETKINAGAVYPHDVIKGIVRTGSPARLSTTEVQAINAQWDAMSDYVGNAKVIPMVDVSGSMFTNNNPPAIDVALALGLYMSGKNTGKFKDLILTFSANPKFEVLKGNVVDKLHQLSRAEWGMSTDIEAALEAILDVGKQSSLPQSEMPDTLLILSDMQFNQAVHEDYTSATAFELTKKLYADAGYEMPLIVFWNINDSGGVPVSAHESGVALVSGYSPAIMESVLTMDKGSFTPFNIMLRTIMQDRYEIPGVLW